MKVKTDETDNQTPSECSLPEGRNVSAAPDDDTSSEQLLDQTSLADHVTEYLNLGFSLIPLKPADKTPLTDALPLVWGKRSWIPYQRTAASTEEVLSWCADYSTAMGGSGLNIGLVTGFNGLYVLDIDKSVLPPCLEATGTTEVRTGRGHWHLYFSGPPNAYPSYSAFPLPDGTTCEFKGVGSYIVAPGSVTESPYVFTRGLEVRQDLSEGLRNTLQELQTVTFLSDGPNPKGGACISEIWQRPLVEGEREVSLYVLYQIMRSAGHVEKFTQDWVRRKNRSLASPLADSELDAIFRHGAEKNVPGHKYPLSCPGVRSRLPWVQCDDCGFRSHTIKTTFDLALREGLSPSENVILQYVVLHGDQSDLHLANQCHLDRRTVKAVRERLQTLRLWPTLPETLN
jgi:hypothetical protein